MHSGEEWTRLWKENPPISI